MIQTYYAFSNLDHTMSFKDSFFFQVHKNLKFNITYVALMNDFC
jgi:hypothetical protein